MFQFPLIQKIRKQISDVYRTLCDNSGTPKIDQLTKIKSGIVTLRENLNQQFFRNNYD
jgi:hypothetical protein